MDMIPFNKAAIVGNELEYLRQSALSGRIAGDQAYSRKCQDLLSEKLSGASVLLTTSCTHALEMSAILLNIQPGDEVIVPSFTFVSTANAFALRGAKIVFADSRRDTLNLDESKLERLVTKRTKAIVPVHYAGISCDMDPIMDLAESYKLHVIEDNAHGLFGAYKDRPLGTIGTMSTNSFHETKNITCGEGGALVVNDKQYFLRAEILREKGTNRSQFFRGEIDKYSWVDIGSSYVASDLLGAYLYGQLENATLIQSKRERIWHFYNEHLTDWASKQGVTLPAVPENCANAYHMFYLVMPSLRARTDFIQKLRDRNIYAVFHYQALHNSWFGRSFGGNQECPIAAMASDCLVRLPFFYDLSEEQMSYICETIVAFNT